ncbi:nuclear transport factor 2 family protein [Gryllotalpicola reticulitermitis]|uniref:Nuclear transport factor 2 family protein n=1 Tax=Gryllotalpicola reticulitermitis TaxID=1184153 RepID=A0ABV8Q2Z4_9MICO
MRKAQLPDVLTEHIRATNAFDTDAILATFTGDAYVQDIAREFVGHAAIRAFIEKEIVGDHVTYDPVEVLEHHGEWIVRVKTDGDYDKSDLPDPLILTHYFRLDGEKIASVITIRVRPADY